ncbi:hypothetical protein GSI_02023 [Ganoderma sinense ZZ0214-1]|uniref:Uncharacterized protein n=1 Tax=Ganoderma sinense ZZ0214-1 TaxID=1077348 RepID=A0A2G8SNZ8_9APHY|nr:hypothetical protein GSI_02023 [Ganoderma sinense ZZ0214-1]
MAALTPMPMPIPIAKLSPPPPSNAFARKAGFADVTFGPRRITFSEPAPPHPPSSPSSPSSPSPSSSHSHLGGHARSSYEPGQQAPAARPPGVRMREIYEHGSTVRRSQWVEAGDERPLAPFVDQQVYEIIVAIWHYYRAIPISKAYKTDRKDGLALAVVVEFTQLCPEYLKYRLVALNRMLGNAYWVELGYA